MNNSDYLEAKAIILKCLKSKKDRQPFDFKRWEHLDFEARQIAMFEQTCPVCRKVKLLTGSWSHVFGTEPCCEGCSDKKYYSRRMSL